MPEARDYRHCADFFFRLPARRPNELKYYGVHFNLIFDSLIKEKTFAKQLYKLVSARLSARPYTDRL